LRRVTDTEADGGAVTAAGASRRQSHLIAPGSAEAVLRALFGRDRAAIAEVPFELSTRLEEICSRICAAPAAVAIGVRLACGPSSPSGRSRYHWCC
jgi:hypothetical protein